MKKTLLFLTLFVAMLTFGARAQVPVFTESFEGTSIPAGWTTIDADQDGFGWEHSSVQGDIPGHTGSGAVASYSYDNLAYEALTPDNWLISPAISLNGTSSLSFWFVVASSYPADHYGVYVSTTSATDPTAFTLLYEMTPTSANDAWTQQTVDLTSYAGNSVYIAFRHFNCTDMLLIGLDDITVSTMTTEPTLTATPSALDFGIVSPNDYSAVATVQVQPYNSTASIAATVGAPFEISTDSISFASTASLPAAGGTLYVRYAPTAEGSHQDSIVLTAGSLSCTVMLNGTCIDCSNITLPFSESFENVDGLSCWMFGSANSANSITLSTPASDGQYSLRFSSYNSADNYNQYAVTPELPVTPNKMVSFEYRSSNTSAELFSVGYSTTTPTLDAFIWGDTISCSNNTDWTQFMSTTIPGDAKYIAINYFSNYLYYLYVDNFLVQEVPSCLAPNNIAVGGVTSNSAVLQWESPSDYFNVYYKVASDTVWEQVPSVSVDTMGYELTGLAAATTYQWKVAAICDDGTELVSGISSFTTECATFLAPFTENFTTSLPMCWNLYFGLASDAFAGTNPTNTTSGWNFNNTNVFGQGHPKINIYGTSAKYWLVTPPIDLSNLSEPTLYFDLALTDYNSASPIDDANDQQDDKFMVIISTDNGATWSASNATVWSNDSAAAHVYNQISTTGENINISLANYIGQTVTIAFYGESTVSNGDNDLHIDNVEVRDAISCPKPTNLTAFGPNDTVTLSWTDALGSSWEVAYGPAGFGVDSDTATLISGITETTVQITGLNAGMMYDFYVRTNCGSDVSDWTAPVTASPNTIAMGISGNMTISSCGATITDDGGASGNYSHNCHYVLTIYPETEGMMVSISGVFAGESSADYLSVFEGTTTNSSALIEKVYSSMNGASSGTQITFGPYTSTSGPLTLLFHSDYSVSYPGFVATSTCVEPPACSKPNTLVAVAAADQAVLTWNSTGSEFNVYYKANSDSVYTEVSNVTDLTYTLTNLTANTEYSWYVVALCGDTNLQSATANFSTPCNTYVAPFMEDFNAAASKPDCWNIYSGLASAVFAGTSLQPSTSGWYFNNANVFGQYHPKINIYGTGANYWLVTPDIDLSTLNTPTLTFDLALTDYNNTDPIEDSTGQADDKFIVAVSTNYGSTWTAVSVWDNTGNGDHSYNQIATAGEEVSISLAQYAGQTIRIAFYGESTVANGDNDLHIDNVVVAEMSNCTKPTGLAVSNITESTADLTWTAGGDEAGWNIEYKEASASTWNTATATSTSHTLTGLMANTEYNVRVQAVCGANEFSNWTITSFTTACGTFVVTDAAPYAESFSSEPSCWNLNAGADPMSWSAYSPYIYHSYGFYTAEAIAPTFDITAVTNPYLKFSHQHTDYENSGVSDSLKVYYRATSSDAWTLLFSTGNVAYDWTVDSVALPAASATYQIKFQVVGMGEDADGCSIDDVTVYNGTGSGPVITDPTVATSAATAVAQTTATLNGTITNPDNVTITAKGFQWKATQGGTYTTVNGTGTGNNFTAALDNLTPNTSYTYKAFITFNGQTVEGNEMTFTTLPEDTPEPCNTPTGLTVSSVTDESITITWNADANVSSWNIQYSAAGGTLNSASSNTNSYTLNGLTPETTYTIQVQANCGDGNLSEWSTSVTGTTTVGIDSWLSNSVSLYPNPAKEYVDIRVDGDLNVSMMEVYDVYGKLINAMNVIENPTRINVSGLANGMYFVRVTTEAGMVTKTFVKR